MPLDRASEKVTVLASCIGSRIHSPSGHRLVQQALVGTRDGTGGQPKKTRYCARPRNLHGPRRASPARRSGCALEGFVLGPGFALGVSGALRRVHGAVPNSGGRQAPTGMRRLVRLHVRAQKTPSGLRRTGPSPWADHCRVLWALPQFRSQARSVHGPSQVAHWLTAGYKAGHEAQCSLWGASAVMKIQTTAALPSELEL